jgi:hypothetical protein
MVSEFLHVHQPATRAQDTARPIQQRDHHLNSVNARQRLGALSMALGITFTIVWGVANYAYNEPTAAGPSPLVGRAAAAKSCS